MKYLLTAIICLSLKSYSQDSSFMRVGPFRLQATDALFFGGQIAARESIYDHFKWYWRDTANPLAPFPAGPQGATVVTAPSVEVGDLITLFAEVYRTEYGLGVGPPNRVRDSINILRSQNAYLDRKIQEIIDLYSQLPITIRANGREAYRRRRN